MVLGYEELGAGDENFVTVKWQAFVVVGNRS